ncbi:MAG TPA: ABC transporter permease subunit [Candidatus Woesebacteria bacterium]|nr:ABC transporter permease subunit [Candidatus Woesebacteria bacterium]
MKALYKKELQFYVNNPIGYIVIILFAVFANFLFVKDIFVLGSASLRPFFDILPWLMMVFIPALTMRTLSEEKKNNTLEVLLSLRVSETQLVLAKFLALLTMVGIGLLLTVSLPFSLHFLTSNAGSKVYIPEFLTGYLGELLLAAAFIAISMFYSSQTKNQVVAFLLSVITLFFLIVSSTDFIAGVLPRFIYDFVTYMSPVTQISNFLKGVLDLRSIYYFLSFTIIFLLLTIIDLERRP